MKQSASYRLAPSEDIANAYARSQNTQFVPFGWPTVMGWEGDEPIGLLGTLKADHAIIAGPLVVTREQNAGPTVLRLIDAYEVVLRLAGIQAYLFSINENHPLSGMIQRVSGDVPYAIEGGLQWFNRRL